ncbi:MFS monosaccharide transporter [Rickenella mellea]|uniref:MFS monosaccharide transporter n=1 Tax=Rickenella mellea TaxID=50990 RepID=A0A4Y7PR80_9AGAM|nr:MFS monosaccharide transporter [Rickenella mellea]
MAAAVGMGKNAAKNKLSGILMVLHIIPTYILKLTGLRIRTHVADICTALRLIHCFSTFAAFGGILFGYDTGTIGGIKIMKDWLRTFGHPGTDLISSSTESLVVSILSAGTFFGALLAAPAGDTLGRKWGIIVANLVFCVGVAMQTASTAIPLFVVGRVFGGLGVGLVSCLVPMYQSEWYWIRGAVVSVYQLAITIGQLLAAIVNNATQLRDNHSSYRIPIAIQFGWAIILVSGMVFLPESPRWLIKKGRDDEAAQSLAKLTSLPQNDPENLLELEDIRANLRQEQELGENSYFDCFQSGHHNRIQLRTLTGIFLQAWQQLTGINFISYYGATFFQNSGIKNPFVISVITNVVNVVMTLPGMWGVERFGRRRLLILGAIGMCVSQFVVAIIGVTVSVENSSGQKVLIAFVCVYIAFFASTWGPVAWVITGEIFPLNVRAKAMSMSTASNWLWNLGSVFFIWGSTCFCCIIFTYVCIPETKGLSLEQIDILYQNATPRKSFAYRRQLLADVTVQQSVGAKRSSFENV